MLAALAARLWFGLALAFATAATAHAQIGPRAWAAGWGLSSDDEERLSRFLVGPTPPQTLAAPGCVFLPASGPAVPAGVTADAAWPQRSWSNRAAADRGGVLTAAPLLTLPQAAVTTAVTGPSPRADRRYSPPAVLAPPRPAAAEPLGKEASFGLTAPVDRTGLAGTGVGVARAFSPNDPFFFPGPNPPVGGPGSTASTTFPGQWHLVNNMPASSINDPAISAGVLGAWDRDLTGTGVTIGIVEDSIQIAHPDLSPNVVAGLSRDFFSGDNDPAPPSPGGPSASGTHGTAVAGVAAARGGNGVGVTGAAPFAGLVGIRTEYAVPAVVQAYGYRNDVIRVKNHSYGPTTPYDASWQTTVAAIAGSAQAGGINVIAAGNDRQGGGGNAPNQDANKAFPQNTPHAVVVAALASNGRFSNYSSFGANVLVTAPSDSLNGAGFFGVTTTDRTGSDGYNTNGSGDYAAASGGGTGLSYTNFFGGTSSSAPLVSGVIALAVQANPTLLSNTDPANSTRLVKHLLARTSTVVDPNDATATGDLETRAGRPDTGRAWRTNAAGFRFNQNYGFGNVNADALTQRAAASAGVTPLQTATTGAIAVGATIPDNNPAGISRTFNVAASAPLEEVIVRFDITHTFRGDLEGYVTSPSGYRSRLFFRSLFGTDAADSGDNINWDFVTNAFWGENPSGTWTVSVADLTAQDIGTWNSFSAELRMGDLVPVPEPASLGLVCGAAAVVWVRRRRRAAG